MSAISRSPISANLKKVDQEIIFCAIFDEKSQNFGNFFKIFSQRNSNQTYQQHSSNIDGNNNTLLLKTLTLFKLY